MQQTVLSSKLRLLVFFVDLLKFYLFELGGKEFEVRKRIREVLLHIPFVLPVKKLYSVFGFVRMRFRQ